MPPSEQQPARLSTVLYARTEPHDRELQRDGGDEQSGVTDEQAGAALGGVQAAFRPSTSTGPFLGAGAGFACATTADEAISGGPL